MESFDAACLGKLIPGATITERGLKPELVVKARQRLQSLHADEE